MDVAEGVYDSCGSPPHVTYSFHEGSESHSIITAFHLLNAREICWVAWLDAKISGVIPVVIKLLNGHARSNDEIAAVEARLGVTFPEPYRAFVAIHDGASPELNQVSTDDGGFIIQLFIPINELAIEKELSDVDADVFVAIAWDGCGDKVLLDMKSGEVRFQDHESQEEPKVMWRSFESFLAHIRPLDSLSMTQSVTQVLSAWIDPEFKRRINGS